MTADVESARQDWESAHRELQSALRDPAQADSLEVQLDVVSRELRKRVGARYTLRELETEYRRAEPWVRDVLAEHAPFPGWPRRLSMLEGAAFHLYARGAVDYEP